MESHTMAEKTEAEVTVLVTEQGSEPPSSSSGTVPAVGRWPSNPQPLTANPWIERGLDAYDAALCLMPVALMIQAVLCVVAAHRDSQWTGFWVDGVSNLTLQLIRVNSQVSHANSRHITIWLIDLLADHCLYHHLRTHLYHLSQAIRFMARTDWGDSCKIGAISSQHQPSEHLQGHPFAPLVQRCQLRIGVCVVFLLPWQSSQQQRIPI